MLVKLIQVMLVKDRRKYIKINYTRFPPSLLLINVGKINSSNAGVGPTEIYDNKLYPVSPLPLINVAEINSSNAGEVRTEIYDNELYSDPNQCWEHLLKQFWCSNDNRFL